jgi:PAS domain S-box-containing protein
MLGLVGPALGLAAYQIAVSYEKGRAIVRFDEYFARRVSTLEKELLTTAETLFALKAFFEGSKGVARDEFRAFTAPTLARHPAVRAFEWIPRIENQFREGHEQEARLGGFENYHITDRLQSGEIFPAAERDEYFPVLFVEPYKGNELALGFNLVSDAIRREALIRAADSGQMAMTDPVKLVQDTLQGFSFLLFLAVYEGDSLHLEARRQALRGFVLLVFRIEDIVEESLLAGESEDTLQMHFRLLDTDATGRPTLIYSCPEFDPALAEDTGINEKLIEMGGQIWNLAAYPTESYLNVYYSKQPFFAGAGVFLTWELFGAFLVLLGIRSREQALTEQAKVIRSVLISLSEGVVVSDLSGKVVMSNKAAERIVGTGAQGLHPENWSEAYGCLLTETEEPFPAERLPSFLALQGEEVIDQEILIRNPRLPQDVIISVSGNPLKDSDGRLLGGVITLRDVTESKRSREEMERLSNVVKQTADSVFITDRKGNIEYVNPAFETTTGYLWEEVQGQNPRILKSGIHESEHYIRLWETISSGNVFRGTTINRKKSGGLFYSEQTITPITNEAGRITHFVSVAKDITELRKAQEQEFEMNLAARVQKKLYPKDSPRISGFDISGAVFSASATCGDYFDYVQSQDRTLTVAVGDVSGHGFGAALVMSETRALLRSFAQSQTDLGGILFEVNRVLFEDLERNRFVTMLLTQIDIGNRRLIFANAGHNPGFILDLNGAVKAKLTSTGFPLGMFATSEYSCGSEIPLNPGDLAVLLTDGVSETKGPDERDFEDHRVLETLRSCRHLSSHQIVNQLYSDARDFAQGTTQQDDMTIVVIKVEDS